MPASDIVTVIGALGALSVTIGGVVVLIINAMRRDLQDIAAKVDGAATASVTKIEQLTKEVATLTATAAERNQTAALLAQTTKQNPPLG